MTLNIAPFFFFLLEVIQGIHSVLLWFATHQVFSGKLSVLFVLFLLFPPLLKY